jgi:hypothetical protein
LKINHYLKLFFLTIVFVAAFYIGFYESGLKTNIITVLGLTYLLVLPGFSLLYKLKLFTSRYIISIPLSIALIGIPSYLLGLAGLHIRYHIIFPIIYLIIGLFLEIKFKKNDSEEKSNYYDSDI